MDASFIELEPADEAVHDLAERLLDGQVYMLKGALQKMGLFEPMVRASLEGVRADLGEQIAAQVEDSGFENIHQLVDPAAIPPLTDSVYEKIKELAPKFLEGFVPQVFGSGQSFYYERYPNVRFHIPYDLAMKHRKQFNEFAKDFGQGKIAAHGPHRDYWLDCPDNAINAWIAVGPVQRGNGLAIFKDDYQHEFTYQPDGELGQAEQLTKPPTTFDMAPGDVLLFHANHLHASELNRTGHTRYVISFRMSFGKPNFPLGHHHNYVHWGMARGPLKALAEVPAKLQMSYLSDRARRVGQLLGGKKQQAAAAKAKDEKLAAKGQVAVKLADLEVGSIKAISADYCVARLDEGEVVAFSRHCTHQGADLAKGFVLDGNIVCPWHNLTFDPKTGKSPCAQLRGLKLKPCKVEADQFIVADDQSVDAPSITAKN